MRKTILLADDDNDDAEIFRQTLVQLDPSIKFAHADTGVGIFEYLHKEDSFRPDIIFLDLNMPEMNGWQCLARIKNEKRFEDIPIIIYTTSSNPREYEISQDLDAHALVIKPSDPKLLKKILDIILSKIGTKQLHDAVKEAYLLTRE